MKLKVFHRGNDFTLKCEDFTNGPNDFDFSQDGILIGFHKPLKKIYAELEAREDDSEIVLESFNGVDYDLILNVEDGTSGLTKSGFISWPENKAQVLSDPTGLGDQKFWVRISLSNDPANVLIKGINLVLSNDKDLSFIPGIEQFLPENASSFIAFHQEARNMIIQMLRNSGKRIFTNGPELSPRQVDQFDLLDIEEFKNASKYLALHLIFDHISKSSEDAYWHKAQRYYERFHDSFNSNLSSIDTNDNGQTDEGESNAVQFIRLTRV